MVDFNDTAEGQLVAFVKAYVAKRRRIQAKAGNGSWPGKKATPFMHELVRRVDELDA